MKIQPLNFGVCPLFIFGILTQNSIVNTFPSSQNKLTRSSKIPKDTLIFNKQGLLFPRKNDVFDNTALWKHQRTHWFPKYTLTRLKHISKRSGIHPPDSLEQNKNLNENSNQQFSDSNFTQIESVSESPSLIQPKVIDEPTFVKAPAPVDETTVEDEPSPVDEPTVIDEPTLVKKQTFVEEPGPTIVKEPIYVEEPTLVINPGNLVPETVPKFVRKFSLLDISYENDEEFWFVINQTYREVCSTRCGSSDSELHGGHSALCAKCWCDTACSLYGDCCPDFYTKNGYTPPMNSDVQGCQSVRFPDIGYNYHRMVKTCADKEKLGSLKHYPISQNGSINSLSTATKKVQSKKTSEELAEAERMCVTPDLAAHWNQSRPITDKVTGLTFTNQYCAECSGVSLKTSTPWDISVTTTSSTLFTASSSVLDIYRTAMTSDDADVYYEPPFPVHSAESTVRECRNYHDVTTMDKHLTRCNQTGRWRHFSIVAERACLLLNLPIYPSPKEYSYRNVYCYYCNNDVTWDQVLQLKATSPWVIDGPGDNILSVLLDLDGSDEKKFLASEPEENAVNVAGRMCNNSQFYDPVKDECRELLCAPGKLPADDQTCSSNPSLQSNVFGYMACYLVTGIPGGRAAVSDLASRLAQEPYLVSDFGSNLTMNAIGEGPGQDYGLEISEAFKATVVKTTRWTCNSCGLLGQELDSATLLVQVAWASQRVLDRNQTEQILVQAEMPLIKLLDITASALSGSSFHVGNLTIMKYPYCSIEDNPVPNSRFKPMPPPVYSGQNFVPAPCTNVDTITHHSSCSIDLEPSVKFPEHIFTEKGDLKNYVNLVQYLPVNSLLSCQYVKVQKEEYSFNITNWSIRLNHCDNDLSAGDVTISETDGAMFVCLKDYACWTRSKKIQNKDDDIHDMLLRWISLICVLLSMACCLITFLTYSCLPQLRSSAGINNMILASLVFFAQGLGQFGSSQRDRHDICCGIGVLTHFFWLAAVAAMSTATYHMFYALSFPLRFQQYHGREGVLVRVYVVLVLLLPALVIASTMFYAQMVNGNFGYASGRNCFVNAGVLRIVFFGVPVLILVLVNIGMYAFTVARLHGTPDIGETNIQRNNAALYSKLSVATGASWIFGFLYEWTDFVGFAYAYMLTAVLLGLFLLLAFVANKRVMDMARVKMPGLLAKLMVTRGDSSSSQSTVKKTRSTSLA